MFIVSTPYRDDKNKIKIFLSDAFEIVSTPYRVDKNQYPPHFINDFKKLFQPLIGTIKTHLILIADLICKIVSTPHRDDKNIVIPIYPGDIFASFNPS